MSDLHEYISPVFFLGILKSFSKAPEDPSCLPTITRASVSHRLKNGGSELSTLF